MSTQLIRHRIFEELREDIMTCSLRPGEEVREGELAKKYGVSKSPIRDALQKLEFEGLVEIAPRRGHRVAQISLSDAEDILELRAMLESGAVRKIAAEASNSQLSSLDKFRTADVHSVTAFAEYNRTFHRTLCEMSGNQRLSDTMSRLMENYDRLCIVSLSTRRTEVEAMEAALADHLKVIDALQDRNGTAAAKLSARHIQRSRTQVMRGLESRQILA